MEENKESTKEKISTEGVKDTEVVSFRLLIDTILDYYYETSSALDSSESWKKGTEHEEKGLTQIPDDVDSIIKQAFKSQLKKFIK